MALKFLKKKGWHAGSVRNIENVWKAEQKKEAREKKTAELKKQIHQERQFAEYRLLLQQSGGVPQKERVEFLYDQGSSSGGFKELDLDTKPQDSETSTKDQQSGSDSWRKLHSDPLFDIRKREQEAIARVKNNPVQMAMIRESVQSGKRKDDEKDGKKRKKLKHSSSNRHKTQKVVEHSVGRRRTYHNAKFKEETSCQIKFNNLIVLPVV